MPSNVRLFPPLRGAVKWLILINVLVFVLQSVLMAFWPPVERVSVFLFALSPRAVTHGWIWQLVTYAFMHADTGHILFNMLTLWVFGPGVEDAFGRKKFTLFYLMCAVFGATITVMVSFKGMFGMSAVIPSLGASGAIMGVMVAFGLMYAESKIYLIPFPVPFKAKYLVALFMGLDILGVLRGQAGIAYFVHIGGAVFAYFYVKLSRERPREYVPEIGRGLSDRVHDRPRRRSFPNPFQRLSDWYQRWRRRRAARKFQLYMKKHGQDQSYLFDEHGNYIGPDAPPSGKKDDDKHPWVN